MNYEISTLDQLKAAVFDAIDKGVVLGQNSLASFIAFDDAVDAYMATLRDDDAIAPGVAPDSLTLGVWFYELKAAA